MRPRILASHTVGRTSLLILCLWSAALVAGPADGRELPEFAVGDYAGRVVVVDFWASWCVPCRRSFPWLNAMRARYSGDGLVIVGVNLDMDRAEADRFLEEYPPEFDVYFDVDKRLANQFGVQAMPSSYVIGRDGTIVAHHLGFQVRKQDEYESAIAAALENGRQAGRGGTH